MHSTGSGVPEAQNTDTAVTDRRKDRDMEEQRNDIVSNAREDEMEIDLVLLIGAMWKGFLRFWWLVLALIVIGAAGFSIFQAVGYEPMYRSSATFTVSTGDGSSGSYSFYYNSSTADQMSRTFPYILNSSFFRSTLLEQLGTDTLNGTISAETITDSNVVTMTVESSSAEDAVTILNAALEIYPDTARFVLGDISFNYLNEPETPGAPYNQMSLPRSAALGGAAGALVALCFLGMKKEQCCIPEGELDLENIKVMSKSECSSITGKMARANKPVGLYENGKLKKKYDSAREAAKHLYMSYQTVSDYCNKKVKKPMMDLRWV